MMADANDAGATGTALLTLWKVGRVELPRITKVYRDALVGLQGAQGADVAGPGEVFALWAKVRGELRRVIVLSARRTEAAGDAVCRAIAEYTGADADGRKSSAVAGQELWRKINDPWEVDPEDPEQNPPPVSPRGTAQDDPYAPNAGAGVTAASAGTPGYLAELTTKAEAVKHLAIAKKRTMQERSATGSISSSVPTPTRSLRPMASGPRPTSSGRNSGPGMALTVRLCRTSRLSLIGYPRPS
jgi:hypothetical protein